MTEERKHIWYGDLTHIFPDCLPHLPGFNLASFQSYLSLDIIHHERGSIFVGGAFTLCLFVDVKRGRNKDKQKFCHSHTMSLIIKIFFSVIYILVWSVIVITTMCLKFLYHNLSSSKRGRLLALWRQSDYVANILMITNSILLL